MKVGIITCNNALNYGARLQAYALCRYLSMSGRQAVVIDYCPFYTGQCVPLWYNPGMSLRELARLFVLYPQRRRDNDKKALLDAFSQMYIPTTERYVTYEQLCENPPECDVYIAGSDQIWNPWSKAGQDLAYFLAFGDAQTQRFSYAASFAVDSLTEHQQQLMFPLLARLDAISVRERSAIGILSVLGLNGTQVCDPAFLLNADQWRELYAGCNVPAEPYLVVYDFENNKELADVARRVARLRGLKICSVTHQRLSYADYDYGTGSPQQFVNLIANASCVVSNSLHGSIFAMIFGVDFYVVNRSDGLNVRMRDLLTQYGIENRIVTNASDDDALATNIDYSQVRKPLEADIAASKLWLEHRL